MRYSAFTLVVIPWLGLSGATIAQRVQSSAVGKLASLEVIVTNESAAHPLRGIRVSLYKGDANGLIIATVSTDEEGRAIFHGVDPGKYRLSAKSNGLVEQRPDESGTPFSPRLITLAAGDKLTSTIKMAPGGVISGRVFDDLGDPCSLAVVRAYVYYNLKGQVSLRQIAEVLTDDRGEYRLYWLPPSRYIVSATPRASSEKHSTIDLNAPHQKSPRPEQSSTAQKLSRGAALSGAIFYPGTLRAEDAVVVKLLSANSITGIDFYLH